jgi:ankyrin repeat protein
VPQAHRSVPGLLGRRSLERRVRLCSRDREKALFEIYSVSNLFLKISKTETQPVTFNLSDQHRTYGQTPLLWAAENGHEAVVQVLLDNGADIGIENTSGWTALQLAVLNRREGVERLLLKYGALEPEDFYGLQKLFL